VAAPTKYQDLERESLGIVKPDCKGLQVDLFVLKTWLKVHLGVDAERGATMVEYVLILALIAILVIGIVALLGSQVSSKFSQASSGIAGG